MADAAGIPQAASETYDFAPLDEAVIREITEAVHRAEGAAVQEAFAQKHAATYEYDIDWIAVETRMHQRQHEAVRTKAQELDVEPAAYYWKNPSAIEDCTVRCLDEWPELNDVAYSRPGDDDLYLVDEDYLAEQARLETAAAAADVLDGAGYTDGPTAASLEYEDLPSEYSRRGSTEPTGTATERTPEEKIGAEIDAAIDRAMFIAGLREELADAVANGRYHLSGELATQLERLERGIVSDDQTAAFMEFEDLPPEFSREDLWSSPVAEPLDEAVVQEITDAVLPASAAPETADPQSAEAGEVLVEATLFPGQVLQIKESALRADEAVRAPEAVHAFEAQRDAELGPDARWWHRLDNTHERAHAAWHQAIRDKCADLGVGAGAYFHSDPDEVANCGVDCAAEWPEITTVATEEYPWDTHLTSHWDIEASAETLTETVTVTVTESSAPVAVGHRDVTEDEWLESVLDEPPPMSDLDSGMGSGY